MTKPDWQLTSPLDAIVFDCDATLSRLEGIDELARLNGVAEEVCQLTAEAMASTGITGELYEKRLSLVQPNKCQVEAMGQEYFNERSPDVLEVIRILQRLKKTVYIMSAGVNPAVTIFAKLLGIPEDYVFAVDLKFDADGTYRDFDRTSPLTGPGGKCKLIMTLHEKHNGIVHIGDGMNDVDVRHCVRRFVGYGGVFYREKVADHSDYYILSTSISPVLPLALTKNEVHGLSEEERQYYDCGIKFIERGEVLVS